MPKTRISFFVLAALTGLLLSAGCRSDEEALAGHLERGDAYLEEDLFAEAIIEFKNVLQIDPNHADAHYGLSQALLNEGNVREGFWELRETVRLDPDNHKALVQFGQISIYAGEFEEARDRADQVLAANPEDERAWLVKGQAHEGLKQPAEALSAYKKAAEVAPDSPATLLVLGNYYRRNGDRVSAEPIFREATERVATYEAQVAMASFYAEDRERSAEAEPFFRKAIEVGEGGQLERAYSLLGSYLHGRDRVDDAVAVLEKGIEVVESPVNLIYQLARVYRLEGQTDKADLLVEQATAADPTDPKPFLVLSSYRGRIGDLDGALEAAVQAIEVDPENRPAILRKAEILLELGFRDDDPAQVEEGRQLVEAVLEQEPSHPGGLFVRAKLDLASGDRDKAIQALRSAIDVRPDWPEAHFLLGSALRLAGQRTAARTELARALGIDSSLVEARRVLAEVHAALGEHEYAVEEGRRYLAENPDDAGMRVRVAQSLVMLDRVPEALAEIESIPAEQRDERVHFALGRIHMARGDDEKARALLLKANAERPNQAQVLRALLQLEERMGMPEVGLERIVKAVEENPDDASLQQVGGLVALAQRRVEDAIGHFEKAIELDAEDMASYKHLADVYVRTGRTAQTIETYEKALAVDPEQPRIHHFLAVLYEMGGQLEKAVGHYEKAIESAPDLAESKNNLAYLYAEKKEKLDRALDLAQDAKALLPDDPNTADTLGWVLYQRGVPTAAIGYLKEAEAGFDPQDSNLGVIRHHLALAYEASGDRDNARSALDRAIEAYESFVEGQRSRGRPIGADPQWYSDARKMRERL